MSDLIQALSTSANSLSAFERALEITQNNILNQGTPGYAAQRPTLEAEPFDPAQNTYGGVSTGVASTRDVFAEDLVWRRQSRAAYYQQLASSLQQVEPSLDVASDRGISASLTALFASFSDWSVQPNDLAARQAVIDRARETALAFRQADSDLEQSNTDAQRQMGDVAGRINELTRSLRDLARLHGPSGFSDAGAETQFYAGLEELSSLAGITAQWEPDGSLSLLLGGETPLVLGELQYDVTVASVPPAPGSTYAQAPPQARILVGGADATSSVDGGQLGGLVEFADTVVPSLLGDGGQQGELNLLAQKFADRVNQLLTSGLVSDPPPVPGVPLFTYDTANPTDVAATLDIDPGISASLLAAIQTTPNSPNGTALALANLTDPQAPADEINGLSFRDFFSSTAERVAQIHRNAGDEQNIQEQLLLQARDMREQVSGVSLEQESAMLLQFQRSYQAAARMIAVLDGLTETVLDMVS